MSDFEELRDAFNKNDAERIRTLINEAVNDLLKSDAAKSTEDAQLETARRLGVTDWATLTARIDSLPAAWELGRAIEAEDLERVKALMTREPALHRAPLGYRVNGPLTCVAESSGPPSAGRLTMAKWMLENGSDVHQGGDGPLMRAALSGARIPMMELLVAHGADVNASWNGDFPIIFAPCETVDPAALTWLVDHGANPNCREGTALDYVIGSYARSSPEQLSACIDILFEAGGTTKYDAPPVLLLLRGQLDGLCELLDRDPALVNTRFPELDCGTTGGRLLTLSRATLLHVATEYRNLDAAALLLDRGADVNARATVDERGVGGQTAIFHAVTQFDDGGLPMAELLIDRGADLTIRVKMPGHYERPGEIVECTPLGYALLFGGASDRKTVTLLRERGAVL